jgi:hypothetical protein
MRSRNAAEENKVREQGFLVLIGNGVESVKEWATHFRHATLASIAFGLTMISQPGRKTKRPHA